MKRILFLISGVLALTAPCRTSAQLLDDLFEDEDFQSSEIDKMQKETAAKNEAGRQKKPLQTTSSKPAPAVAAPPVARSAPAVKPATDTAPALKTFSLSASPQAIKAAPVLPSIGAGGTKNMPSLGKSSKSDENLSLFERRAKKTGTSNTDVSKFDIAGIRLKMMPQEVIERATAAGFLVKSEDLSIPETKEWKYHRSCLERMFFGHRAKKSCIRETARREDSEYVRKIVFENKERRETLTVEFTSKSSQNQAYRIRYVSKGDHSLGTTEEARYLRAKRYQEFMELLIKKYGYPDDSQSFLWGLAGVNATLQAEIIDTFSDFTLIMENASMEDGDDDAVFTENFKADPLNKFSF